MSQELILKQAIRNFEAQPNIETFQRLYSLLERANILPINNLSDAIDEYEEKKRNTDVFDLVWYMQNSSFFGDRSEAIMYLEKAPPFIVHYVIRALQDPDDSVQDAAIRALGKINHPLGAEPLKKIINDDKLHKYYEGQRVLAIKALGEMKDEKHIDFLKDIMEYHYKKENIDSSEAAIESLLKIGTKECLDIVIKQMKKMIKTLKTEDYRKKGEVSEERLRMKNTLMLIELLSGFSEYVKDRKRLYKELPAIREILNIRFEKSEDDDDCSMYRSWLHEVARETISLIKE